MPNTTQATTSFAAAIAFLAGLLAGRGVFGFDQATWITILTGAGGFGMLIWNAVSTRKSAMVSTVANMPEVKKEGGIILDKTVPGTAALEAATPANVVSK